MTPQAPPNPPAAKTSAQITLLLVEAQRGLMAALVRITSAIEEVHAPEPAVADHPGRDVMANRKIADALDHNADFLIYARRASTALLERIAPGPIEDKF